MISLVGLSTSTLLWLAAGFGAAISLLYLLRLRRRQVVVPFLPLWQKVVKQSQYQSLWQRLKRLFSWLLQIVLLLLLILALGDPRLRAELVSGRHLVLIVDTSASMQTLDGRDNPSRSRDTKANKNATTNTSQTSKSASPPKSPGSAKTAKSQLSRLAEAKHKAREMIRSLVGNDRIMLISMDAEVVPLTPFTSDQRLLQDKLKELKPSETKADLKRALLLAKDALEGRKMAEIVVISDGAFGADVQHLLRRKGQLQAPKTRVVKAAIKPRPVARASARAKASDPDQVKDASKVKEKPSAARKPTRKARRRRARWNRRKARRNRRRARRKRSRRRRGKRQSKPPAKRALAKLPKGVKRKIDTQAMTQVSNIHRKLPRFRWLKVGKSRDNVGIVALSARRRPNHPLQFSVYVELHNYGLQPVEGFLEIYVGDLIMETVRVALKAGQRWRHIIPRLTAQGQRLSARLKVHKGKDLLKADNQAFAVLPKARAMRVLLVSADNLYLQAALLADPQITMHHVLCGKEATAKGNFDVYIYNDCAPKQVPTVGRYVFFNPPVKGSPFQVRGRRDKPVYLKNPIVTEQRDSHRVMQFLSLRDLNIRRALRLRLGQKERALVSSFGNPLVVAHETKSMRALAVGFSLQESDMVLRVAFPLFLRNTLEWLARGGRSAPPTTRQTGQIWQIPLPSTIKQVTLTSPDKGVVKLPVSDGVALFSGKLSGFYRLSFGKNERWIAANLADPEESSIAPGAWETVQGKRKAQSDQLTTGLRVLGMQLPIPRPIWLYLLLLVVVLLGVEWITYNRRVTV